MRLLVLTVWFGWTGIFLSHTHAQTPVAPTVGDGLTTTTAYQITEIGNLVWLGERAAANDTAGKYYTLMNDIDASVTATWDDAGTTTDTLEGFKPIGTYSTPDRTSFRGFFDGNGKKIIGLTINRPATGYAGLFACVGVSGRIRDLTLEEGRVTGAVCVGGMAGSNAGRLIGCFSSISVVGTDESVGGLVGENTEGSRVTSGTASGSVTGAGQVGGLVGTNYFGTLENCSASGKVVGSRAVVGGLIGDNTGTVTDCFATGAVTADLTVGGLIGGNNAKIQSCFATGPVTGNLYIGGLAGGNNGIISNCFATGSVAGYNRVGGLSGYCMRTGLETIGGEISNCFATGSVTGTYVTGGLVGLVIGGTVTNSYWDKTTTGQAVSDGSAASFGKTTADLKHQATFQPEGGTGASDWDFSSVWKIVEGQTYPYFQAARPPFRLSLAVDAFGALTLNPSGTTVYTPGTTVTYAPGTTVTLTATPLPKYRLSRWIGPVADPSATSTTTVLMDAHKSVTVCFELNEYKVSVEATSGSVTVSPDQPTYSYGTVVTLTATPDVGYRFAGWTGNVADRTAASTSLVITGNMTVTARFLRGYEIRTLEELQAIATGDLTGYYILMNDIDASATATWNDAGTTTDTLEGFNPIGTYSYSSPDTVSFRGVFDGNGKKITGLTINRSGQDYMGLFGMVGTGGEIRNLTIESGTILGNLCAGGLIGINRGLVTNCTVTGQVTGGTGAGGLIGSSADLISKCYFNGEVSAQLGSVGGLLGSNSEQGSVTDCSATGTVTAGSAGTGIRSVGGLIGGNYGTVVNGSASSRVVGTNLGAFSSVGGLVGENFTGASIASSFASGLVDGTGNGSANLPVGGLVGINNASIRNCFATGPVMDRIGMNTRAYGGGLVGFQKSGKLENSFATGSVTASEGTYFPTLGGLIGNCEGGSVGNCFANGLVTGTGTYVGGCIGRVYNSTVKACYWDVETSGQTSSAGGTGAAGKTTTEMKQQATFQPGGGTGVNDWDFTSIWGIVERQSYPFLRTESEPPLFRLDVSVTGQGSVTLDPPGGLYAPGTVVTLTATANTGWHLLEWLGSVTDPNTPVTSIVLDTPKSVTARFLPSHEIRTQEELQALTSAVPGEYYILMNDIDASDTANWNDAGTSETDLLEGFRPIGTYSNPDTTSFRAIFNGNGKKITGLTINRPDRSDIGLFGVLGKGGEIRNLTLEQGRVVGDTRVGGLVGTNAGGTVSNCSADVQVKGGLDVGGLVGSNRGKLTHCSATGSITGNLNVGGLTGEHMTGIISDCSATASVMAEGDSGGLIGLNGSGGIVINSFATGDVAGTGQYLSSNNSFGGLIGYTQSDGKIECCYATGNVTAQGQKGQTLYMGGLIGYNGGDPLTNCFATGSITCEEGESVVVGGLVGYVAFTRISKCFALGRITCGHTKWPSLGGLVGNGEGIITACYWDKETTGQITSSGSNVSFGKTTAEMKQQATFQPDGGTGADDWDFASVWGIVEGQSYPYLGVSSEPPSFRLNVLTRGEGSVVLDPPGGVYAVGTQVTLTAVPNAGSRFIEWTGSVANRQAVSTTVVLDTHKNVTARFLHNYEIRTLAELQAIATGDLTGYYTLMNDIDASETTNWNDAGTTTDTLEGFRPIGTYSIFDTTSFRGIFDGNGKKITGLTVNTPGKSFVGLFGCIGSGGKVMGLTLEGGRVTGGKNIGGLAGFNYGSVYDCAASVSMTATSDVGGLVGANRGSIMSSSSSGVVNSLGTLATSLSGGGLVGINTGLIENSFATGVIMAERKAFGSATMGGLVGVNSDGSVKNCFATGPVSGYNTLGGLVGKNQGKITNSFSSGAVTSEGAVGGLLGDNNYGGSVTNCFATGRVTKKGLSNNVGGLIGSQSTAASTTACYWDMETTSQTTSAGGVGVVGKTTAEMKQQATFQPGSGTGADDWDFTTVWGIFEGETCPFLRTVAPLHRLSVAVEGQGTVTIGPPGTFVAEGTAVTLTARPNAGSRFARWTGDVPAGDAGQNPLKIRIQKDTALTVRFEAATPQPAVWMLW